VTPATAETARQPTPVPVPASINWHIITGEYPPQRGGVSDYTQLVAARLADAGDRVVVWAPRADAADLRDPRVDVRRLPDRFGPRSLRLLSAGLDRAPGPYRLLVQYVPHAFGWKAANLLFCLWLRSRRKDGVWVMFHEVAYPFDRRAGLARNALAAVNRLMASLVGRAAERAFVSIPAWRSGVGSVTRAGTPVMWLPVPSSIAVAGERQASADIRARYGQGAPLVGHFGTYGDLIQPMLDACLPELVERSGCRVLLLGHNSDAACRELVAKHPGLSGRMHGSGTLTPDELSHHVSACDVMLQPYPDGISSRRTSAMVALSHAVPIVTTIGPLTEPIWEASGAAVLVPVDDPGQLAAATASLLTDGARRASLARHAAAVYDQQFDLRHTISALRFPS
jgi:glycosyltransferase involved in cell wall biosynthesis